MDDLEDGEEFNSNVIKTKKKRRNTETNLSNPDEAEFVEYVLMDLRNPEELNKFKNMKYLSLIQQGIQSIEVKIP